MKGIASWVSLGTFLVIGIILLEGQPSEATDATDFTIPTNDTSILIEEEKEEDEINATTPTNTKIEQFSNTSKQP
jgi:hypothetical protein